MLTSACMAWSQPAVHDSVDVLHTHIVMDLGHRTPAVAECQATLSLRLLREVDTLRLRLIASRIDSVAIDGAPVPYSHTRAMLSLGVAAWHAADTHTLFVRYTPSGYVENDNLGGFHLDRNIHYTVGVALHEHPHSFGRTWFPCQDDFHDKCTFSCAVTPPIGWDVQCGGLPDSVTANADGSLTHHYSLRHTAPAYLMSVTAAHFHHHRTQVQGLAATYPLTVAYTTQDSAAVAAAFEMLDDVVPAYERLFGPYRWERIGYCATPVGSMEHINNISLVSACAGNLSRVCQMVVAHELAHAWFGNLVTCGEASDMWWNEGGASFCEEVALEAMTDPATANLYALSNLEQVLRTAHIDDDGYRALSGMDSVYTYGTTVYHKGATFFHALRGHLGDSVFYAALRQLFANNAFTSLNSDQLRDSLSLYSGRDLSDFFAFHLSRPGFADYLVDSLTATDDGTVSLHIVQNPAIAPGYCRDNRVPVTFVATSTGLSATLWFQFADSVAHLTARLPFRPDYAVVDLFHHLSTAGLADTLHLAARSTRQLPLQHFKTTVRTVADSAVLSVTHHFSSPACGAPLPAAVVRTANRFWHVQGVQPEQLKLNGQFNFCRGTGRTTASPYLDYGFYNLSSTLDSIALLYRPTLADRWTIASRMHSGTAEEGYFITNTLKTGYYTLGVIDTARLGTDIVADAMSAAPAPRIIPNPSGGRFSVIWPSPLAENKSQPLTLTFYDATCRLCTTLARVMPGEPLRPSLPTGHYTVVITCGADRWTQKVVIQ